MPVTISDEVLTAAHISESELRQELALALFGMSKFDRGDVCIEGKPIPMGSNARAIDAGIAYVSEDRLTLGMDLRQSIADNVSIAVLDRLRGRFGKIAYARRAAFPQTWIDTLKIRAGGPDAAGQTLSGGNQQRVVLAKWLATRPKVLILDGPTIGVDIRNKAGIHEIVRALANEGMAILLISDEVSEVYFNSDRILHMRAGRIAGEFVPGPSSQASIVEALDA